MKKSINEVIKNGLPIFSAIILTLLLLTNVTDSYATISVDTHRSPELAVSSNEFIGTVHLALYLPQEHLIRIGLHDKSNQFIELNFTEADLSVGTALLNTIGKDLRVQFSDTKFTVSAIGPIL